MGGRGSKRRLQTVRSLTRSFRPICLGLIVSSHKAGAIKQIVLASFQHFPINKIHPEDYNSRIGKQGKIPMQFVLFYKRFRRTHVEDVTKRAAVLHHRLLGLDRSMVGGHMSDTQTVGRPPHAVMNYCPTFQV